MTLLFLQSLIVLSLLPTFGAFKVGIFACYCPSRFPVSISVKRYIIHPPIQVYSTRVNVITQRSIKLNSSGNNESDGFRVTIKKFTGFSLTTLRTTVRVATGLSFTGMRATLRGLTGVSVTGTMKAVLRLFPAWFRYFLQPFLILYYVPLLTVQGWIGSSNTSRLEAKASHDVLVESWRNAVRVAEQIQSNGYWPIHVDGNGVFTAVLPPDTKDVRERVIDINESIVESVEISLQMIPEKK